MDVYNHLYPGVTIGTGIEAYGIPERLDTAGDPAHTVEYPPMMEFSIDNTSTFRTDPAAISRDPLLSRS